jgi:hypothetical protein
MQYLRKFFVVLMVSLAVVLGVGASGAAAAALGPADCKEYVVRASLNSSNDPMCRFTFDAAGALTIKNEPMNMAMQGSFDIQQKPLLGKGQYNVILGKESMKVELQFPVYFEESADSLTVYCYFDGKWVKKSFPIPEWITKLNEKENADRLRQEIKSVSLLSQNKDEYIFEVVTNPLDTLKNLKPLAADAQFKPVMDLLAGDFKYKVTVDKRKKVVTHVSMDMSEWLAKVGAAIGQTMKSGTDKEEFEKFIASLKLTIDAGVVQADSVPPIVIPAEARNAPELGDTIGYVDMKRVRAESPVIKSLLDQSAAKQNEVAEQLAAERDGLSDEEFAQREAELNQELTTYKNGISAKIQKLTMQAMTKVKAEKKLTKIIMIRKSSGMFDKVVDVTDAVIEKIEAAAE